MGNWTDRFDPETVDEIKRYEVGEGDFLLAERLAMHKGVESVFGFHVNCLGLGKPYWEKGVYLGDVLDFFDRHGETLIEKRAGQLARRFHRGRESERVSAKGTCAVRVDIGAGEGALREAGEGQIP